MIKVTPITPEAVVSRKKNFSIPILRENGQNQLHRKTFWGDLGVRKRMILPDEPSEVLAKRIHAFTIQTQRETSVLRPMK